MTSPTCPSCYVASFLVVIPGFGGPLHVEEKIQILENNLRRFSDMSVATEQVTGSKHPILVIVRVYDNHVWKRFQEKQEQWNSQFSPYCIVDSFFQPGKLATFLRQGMSLSTWKSIAPYLFVILDDVEICPNVNLFELRSILEGTQSHVVSPALHVSSTSCHSFMKQSSKVQKILFRTNFLECFGLLFSQEGWTIYHGLIPEWNQYLWGMDMIMYPYGHMDMFLVPFQHLIHHFSSKFDKSPFYTQMTKELDRMTKQFPQHLGFQFKILEKVESPIKK